jgi:hypothetical protein
VHEVFAGGAMDAEYVPGGRFATLYVPPVPVVVVPTLVPPCDTVTVIPDCPEPFTSTVPEILPGIDVQSKLEVAATFDCTVTSRCVGVHVEFAGGVTIVV